LIFKPRSHPNPNLLSFTLSGILTHTQTLCTYTSNTIALTPALFSLEQHETNFSYYYWLLFSIHLNDFLIDHYIKYDIMLHI